ncbi:MAG: PxKF domain-containing protein [Acidobacteriota bacterium]|nr:PxKF domain-containing protein [Acidobacteriota bacterium]
MKKLHSLLVALAVVLFLPSIALAQADPPPVPGEVFGTGFHFEITNSDYLDVVLDSTEEVDVRLHAMGEMIIVSVAAASGATSTELTISGLAPNTTYYLRDDGPEAETFISDANGSHVLTQDLAEPRLLMIRTTPGTYHITSGQNECNLFGTWDEATKTCTLTQDISDYIYVYQMPGLTLDGNGYRLTYSGGYSILARSCNDCTIKNFDIDSDRGVALSRSDRSTLVDNTIRVRREAVSVFNSWDVTVSGNTFNGWYPSFHFFNLQYSYRGVFTRNTASGFSYSISLYRSHDNLIYNNNIESDASFKRAGSYWSSGNAFNKPFPEGGNWWGHHDDPGEGCHDIDGNGCCDDALEVGWEYYMAPGGLYDHLPWTEPNGWEGNQPPVADAGPDQTLGATCSGSDRTSPVTLDGSSSYDPDDDSLTYSWEGPTCPTTPGVTPSVDLDRGSHTITLMVDDGNGGTATDDVVITLQDTTAPEVTAPAASEVACTQVSAEGLGQCPADDLVVVDWLASAAVSDACDPAPAMTDDCPPILGVDTTTVTFTGTDVDGNAGTDSSTVQVLYGWGGFKPPIRDDGEASIKQSNKGRTIPIKFTLDCGGTSVSGAVASIAVYKMLDTDTGTVDETDMTEDSGNSGDDGNVFRWDAVDQHYIFNLATKGYDAPATYQIHVTLDDGTVKIVEFSLRK